MCCRAICCQLSKSFGFMLLHSCRRTRQSTGYIGRTLLQKFSARQLNTSSPWPFRKPADGLILTPSHTMVRPKLICQYAPALVPRGACLTTVPAGRPLSSVERTLVVEPRCASWSLQQRDRDWARAAAAAAAAQEALAKAQGGEAAAAAEPASFILRSLYLPEQGMFRQMEADLQLGQRLPVRVAACLVKHLKNGCRPRLCKLPVMPMSKSRCQISLAGWDKGDLLSVLLQECG